jgi:thioester reductase-like protein
VFCLSRAKSHEESAARVKSSLQQRQRVLKPTEQAKIVSWAADVNKPDLGLKPEEYKQLSDLATSIIVNAWPVNFTLSLASFDPHVGGAINLLNLAQESVHQATYYFSSSVGTRQGRIEPVADEAFPDSPSTAGGMGYGQSKWVVEKTLERAALEKGARVGVLRIGQLVGDTTNGVWNETEAWPLMFKSANAIGALPALDERLSWLPVDLAAKGITEVATQPEASYKSPAVYHIVNADSSSVFSKQLLDGLRLGGLEFETVDRAEWLRRLEESEEDVEKNPTKKLFVSTMEVLTITHADNPTSRASTRDE